MSEQPLVNLSCSFCGKSQNEVRKLIAGPKVCICDECIGLCNQIIGEAFSAIGSPSPTPESARGLMAGLVELALPEAVRKALMELVVASSALRGEMHSWGGGESESRAATEVSAWLRPSLERLSGTVEALRALRPALEGLVSGARIKVLDDAVGQLAEVRGLLVTVAEKESRGNARRVD